MLNKVKEYCSKILSEGKCSELPFHNLVHTKEVVQNIQQITKYKKINESDLELVTIAAWFHDTGFSSCYNGHEEVSKKIARNFLLKKGMSKKNIDIICNCIEATKMPQNPKGDLEKILCDADLMHVSTDNFFYRKLLLRREWEIFLDKKVSDIEWHLLNKNFLEEHEFWTKYGMVLLQANKQINIDKVEELIKFYN